MAANWGENTWGSSGWGGYTLLNSNAAAGAVGSLTASISVDIGISRFLLEDGSGYLLLEDGSYLMEEAGTGPIPSINGAVGTVVQAKTIALTGVAETSAVGSTTQSTTVASTGVSATGNAGTNPADTSELLVGVAASGGAGSLTPSITVSIVPGWGLGAWGSGVWGSSSPAIAGTVGDSTPATSVANTGVFATGNTSSVTPDKTAALSGVASSGNIGTVAPSTEVSINAGWGIGAWGSGAWGAGSTITGAVGSSTPSTQVASTGNAAAGQVGSVIYNRIEFITGVQELGAVGGVAPSTTITVGISRFLLEDGSGYLLLEDGSYLLEEISSIDSASWGVGAWGLGAWGGSSTVINAFVGNVSQNYSFSLTGKEAAASVGTTTPSTTVALTTSWGSNAWGYSLWGGNSASIIGSVGNVVYSPELKGVQASGSVGQMTPSITVDIGISRFLLEDGSGYLLLEDGSYLMEEAGTGPIPSINGAVGTAAPATSVVLDSKWGIGTWGSGTWSSGLLITGAVNEMIAVSPAIRGVHGDGAAGTPVSNITVAITGAASQGAAGYLEAVKSALLSGVVATGNVGVLGVVKSYWDIIDDAQNANWAVIPNAQTATWGSVYNPEWGVNAWGYGKWNGGDSPQTADWAVVPNTQTPGWGPANISGWGANAWGSVAWGETQDAGWELIPTAFDQN